MPIGAAGSPHFGDFTNPKEDQAAKTHHLPGIIHQIRQSSVTADFNGKSNLSKYAIATIGKCGVSLRRAAFRLAENRKTKGGNAGCDHWLLLGDLGANSREFIPGKHICQLI